MSTISKSKDRPSLTKDRSFTAEIKEMLEKRKERYNKAADYVIDTTHLSVEEIVYKIIRLLKG